MKKLIVFGCIILTAASVFSQKKHILSSPDKSITITVETGEGVKWSVKSNNVDLVLPSKVDILLQDGESLAGNAKKSTVKYSGVSNKLTTELYSKSTLIESYNEMRLRLKPDVTLVFRAYNEGVAYRWETSRKNDLVVRNEISDICLPAKSRCFVQYANSKDTLQINQQFRNSFENLYAEQNLSEWSKTRLAVMPLMVQLADFNLNIMDMNIQDYPGMYLQNFDRDNKLEAVFAPFPKKTIQGGHNNLQSLVVEQENFIAKVKGTGKFPWRMIAISEGCQIAQNDLAYLLSEESRIADVSWIKPGKAAWDWWNNINLKGVSFKAGINTASYKYFVDFAADNKLEYIIIDEGFNVLNTADLLQVIPGIDLKEICNYAASKNVGVILWAGMYAINKDMEKVCKHYAGMGVKGFKVDFLDRDDQEMMNFTWKLAETCARHRLLLDFHGVFKPNGLQRTYPNVITFEGVFGLEVMKWRGEKDDMVKHNVTIPFIRNVAGPMDYTPGSMRNATRKNYRSVFDEPMSQGTRCHQMAQYVVYFSGLSMLSDSPVEYKKEQECTDFIKDIPTVWDETLILDGKPAEFIVTARRKGDVWYVGGMTNWESRSINVDLSFIKQKLKSIELFSDGMNADRNATDYKRQIFEKPDSKMNIDMMPGGGFVMKISVE
jgi:alpha-glucosidase